MRVLLSLNNTLPKEPAKNYWTRAIKSPTRRLFQVLLSLSFRYAKEPDFFKLMNLDCHTPKGKTYIQKQHETGLLIESFFGVKVKHTTYDAEKHDSYLYKDDKLIGVCEIKSRDFFSRDGKSDFTLAQLKKGGYLITADKLDNLQKQSLENKINSYVFVNALRDRKLLCFKISNPNGDFICNFTRDRTVTMNTCNDYKGTVKRINAFIPVVNNSSFKYFDILF